MDPETLDGDASPVTARGPSALVFAYDAVWVASAQAVVQQFSPDTYETGPVAPGTTVGPDPSGIAAGRGAIWVACREDDSVWRIPAEGFGSVRQITVGDGPSAVAVGAGAVWVANEDDGTVSRIDPEPPYEVKTIEVGNAPAGIAVWGGRVWVSVQARLPT